MDNGEDISAEKLQLLRSVAEQLKLPLTIIARQAELGMMLADGLPGKPAGSVSISDDTGADLVSMRLQAHMALGLIDSYLLGLQLIEGQGQLELEPVSVSSLLVETAHELQGLARQYDVSLAVTVAGRYEPVMANQRGLRAALMSLGYALLGAQPEAQGRQLTLAVHRTAHGITAGVYGQFSGLRAIDWRQALQLCGKARQPFTMLSVDSGAGLFVAEAILQAMNASLRVGKHQNKYGLATTLQPSQQLCLV